MRYFFLIALFSFGFSLTSQTIMMNELDPLTGEKWTGLLTYLNYSSEKTATIAVELKVNKLDKGVYQFVYSYPKEPEANSKSKVKIGVEGRTIAKAKILDVKREIDGTITIVAALNGKDNKKKAVLHFDYTFNSKSLIIRKRVKYEGTDQFFVRNSFRLKR